MNEIELGCAKDHCTVQFSGGKKLRETSETLKERSSELNQKQILTHKIVTTVEQDVSWLLLKKKKKNY